MDSKQLKHTPGPWTLYGGYCDGEYVIGADGFPVADIEVYPVLPDYHAKLGLEPHEHYAQHEGTATIERPDEEWQANARLIAAAPELFALANRVARLNEHAGEIGAGMLASLIEDARAAIAKAQGGAE